MMRGIRHLVVVYGAVAGLLLAGAVTASMEVAHADTTLTSCLGAADTATPYKCALSGTVTVWLEPLPASLVKPSGGPMT